MCRRAERFFYSFRLVAGLPSQRVERVHIPSVATTDRCGTSPNPGRIDALVAINVVPCPGDASGGGVVDLADLEGFESCATEPAGGTGVQRGRLQLRRASRSD